MAKERVQRRLAAILVADVVGYSRLMGEDEESTLETLKTYRRDLIDPKLAAYSGRIVKLMGDGALVEFASVVDAVECAVDVQRGMAEVASPADVVSRVEEANSAKRKSVLMLLDRGGDQRFVAVEINRS